MTTRHWTSSELSALAGPALTSGARSGLPVPERPMLVRERLLDRVRERWSVPVTLISAPAGYGKTTLLAQAVAVNRIDPVGIDWWLTCRADPTAMSTLREGLWRGVVVPAPSIGGLGVRVDKVDDGIDVAAAVAEAMRRRSPQPVCLLLDDVHEIAADPEAVELLASVVASLPSNGHVVMAGRALPPLPSGSQALHLDENDLAFTDAEVAAFAALRGAPPARLADRGAWPALAELSLGGPDALVRDYVEQEVLSPLPPATRRALALLAHLGPFDDDLARTVLGPDLDVSEVVAGIPLVASVEAGGAARRNGAHERQLHPLWRTLLAREVQPDEVACARRRAAARLCQRGRATAAVPLLFEAGTGDELSRAIIQALIAPRPSVTRDLLGEWLAALPADLRPTPSGRLLAAVVAAETDPDRAWRALEGCVATFRAQGDAVGELASIVHLGTLAWWADRSEPLNQVARRILELAAEGCAEAVPLTPISRALLGGTSDDRPGAPAEPAPMPPGTVTEGTEEVVKTFESVVLLQSGNVEAALEHAEKALACAGPTHAPLIEATRLHALRCQGRIAEVVEALPGVLRRIEQTGYRHAAALAAAHGVLVHALQGQREEAESYLARARAYVTSTEAPMVQTALAIADAALAVAAGDEAAAQAGLAAELTRHPLDEGLSAGPHRWSIALIYVLVPESRPAWDEADLGPALAVARDLARTILAVRKVGRLPPRTSPLPDAALVQAHLPHRWVAELVAAAAAAGRQDGTRLLEATWPAIGPVVASLADDAGSPLRRAARVAVGRLAVPPTERIELRFLGPLELRRGGVPVHGADWRRERVRSLLAYLALYGKVSRDQLANDLWPGHDADSQDRNLRVTLTYALRALEPDRASRSASFFIDQDGNHIALRPSEWLTVDVWDFDAACLRAHEASRRGSTAEALVHALTAVELWHGEATELASESWAVTPLEGRRVRFVAAALRAAQLLLARGNVDQARTLAERALNLDPWQEAAHRVVVASHDAVGDHLAARRALRRYREALDELGVAPDEATRLSAQLLAGLSPPARPLEPDDPGPDNSGPVDSGGG